MVQVAVPNSDGNGRRVLMPMMGIVLMFMVVVYGLVRMAVHMMLGEMEPDPRGHRGQAEDEPGPPVVAGAEPRPQRQGDRHRGDGGGRGGVHGEDDRPSSPEGRGSLAAQPGLSMAAAPRERP